MGAADLRVDMALTNELVVTDAMPTKSTRKRRAPMGELSGKDELGREPRNDRDFGADGQNNAVIGESCKRVPASCGALDLIQGPTSATTTKAKKPTSKQFWYYQPIPDDEPEPVDRMQRDQQLGKSGLEPYGILC